MSRLYVIPAREAHWALVLRRGPSAWYHLIHWNTCHDTFMHGAWFKGRIYEEKCDLSTDGRLFVYSALHGRRDDPDFPRIYTAVSRAPWIEALVVWPQDSTYGGGGQFTGPRTLWGWSEEDVQPEYPIPTDRQFGVKRLQLATHAPLPRPMVEPVPGADWTGRDFAGQLIYSNGDLLYRRQKGEDVLVADFSDLKPDPQPAPQWATEL
jgi:hypothetical protein